MNLGVIICVAPWVSLPVSQFRDCDDVKSKNSPFEYPRFTNNSLGIGELSPDGFAYRLMLLLLADLTKYPGNICPLFLL